MANWKNKADLFGSQSSHTELKSYIAANIEIIRKTVKGIGIDSGRQNAASGVRVVFNLSSVHVRPFLSAGYKNCYDLASAGRLGGGLPPEVSKRRRSVDTVIAEIAGSGVKPEDLYYGAVELNGSGMRYYGDMCLVLNADTDTTPSTSLVLYRNSYDLDRNPLRGRIEGDASKFRIEADNLAGKWTDVPDMAVCKIMDGAALTPRLITSGFVSEGILADEDYLEVPRVGAFRDNELSEVRTAASDVAAETRVTDRLLHGPTPSLAQILWRHRRRDAERVLESAEIPVRVITTLGRTRG